MNRNWYFSRLKSNFIICFVLFIRVLYFVSRKETDRHTSYTQPTYIEIYFIGCKHAKRKLNKFFRILLGEFIIQFFFFYIDNPIGRNNSILLHFFFYVWSGILSVLSLFCNLKLMIEWGFKRLHNQKSHILKESVSGGVCSSASIVS